MWVFGKGKSTNNSYTEAASLEIHQAIKHLLIAHGYIKNAGLGKTKANKIKAIIDAARRLVDTILTE